jgi:hypothetical protein
MVNLNHYYKKQQYWQHKQQLKEERLIDSTQLNEQRKHDDISGQKPITLLEVYDDPRWEPSWNA